MIWFFAFFHFSSSPPDTMSAKSHHVNMSTAAPKANTLKNAIILPIIPSNPAVFQKNHQLVSDQFPGVPIVPPFPGMNMVYTRLGILRNKNPIKA